MTAPPTTPPAGPASWILGHLGELPPTLKLAAFLLPVVVFVAWGWWAWVGGAVVAAALSGPLGTDGVILGCAFGGAIGYVLNCRWNAYADCRWCKGQTKRRDKVGHFHFCFVCGGGGKRTRFGAYAWSKYRDKDG